MRALATWCVRHRRLVVLFWIAALVVVSLVAKGVGSDYSNSFTLPKTQSTDAIQLLQAASPKVSGDVEQVVFQTSDGAHVTDPAIKARIDTMVAKLAKVPHVSNIVSPYQAEGAAHISKDGTIAFVTVTFDQQAQNLPTSLAKTFVNTAETADSGQLHVAVSGQLGEASNKASLGGTGPGILLAAVVLLPRVRVPLRHGPPADLGPGLAGNRHWPHRPTQQRDEDARIRQHARGPDRSRCRASTMPSSS